MSFFDKMKASMGIGTAKVDTRLEKDYYAQGETVQGTVYVLGGKIEQEINGVYIHVMTEVLTEGDDHSMLADVSLLKTQVCEHFTIQKGEEKTIPFAFTLPPGTPLTMGDISVWLHTELDVSFALDQQDNDYISVTGSPTTNSFLKAMDELGFQLHKLQNSTTRRSATGVFQELEYKPRSGPFADSLKEVDIRFVADERQMDLYFEIERKEKGLAGLIADAIDANESRIHMQYDQLPEENVTWARAELTGIFKGTA